MAQYTAEVEWHREDQVFVDKRYRRKHLLRFDGGIEVPGSASAHIVPAPMSDAAAVDPEEMFVASLASCHMLWFLSVAAKRKFRVERYVDSASGVMEKNAEGKVVMSVVTLRPEVLFSGEQLPTNDEIAHMHHESHAECFLANSVKSVVQCHPVFGR